jgi:hypothetical protein
MIFRFFKTRQIFNLLNLFFFSVIINFCLFLSKWSPFITECNWISYYIIGTFEILVIGASFLPCKSPAFQAYRFHIKNLKLKKITIRWAYLFVLGVVCLSAYENHALSGSFFPALKGIDVHTDSIKTIGPLIRACLPISYIFSYLEFRETHSPFIVIFTIFEVFYMIVGVGSRYWFLSSIIVAVYFVLFANKIDRQKNSLLTIIKLVALLCGVGLVLVLAGEKRIGSLPYSSYIQYNGPFSNTAFGEILAWYYGYFPYSFQNLNLSVAYVYDGNLFTGGKLFWMPFAYVSQIRYFLPFSYDTLLSNIRLLPNGSATVPTAFLYFFADFGFFYFITPGFYILIYWVSKNADSVLGYGFAAMMASVFWLFSFGDMFQWGLPILFFLILWLAQTLFIKKEPSVSYFEESFSL